jgi:hypothetical protein
MQYTDITATGSVLDRPKAKSETTYKLIQKYKIELKPELIESIE